MANVAVIYWSGTGNTEAMAGIVKEGVDGAGGSAEIIAAADWDNGRVDEFEGFALGCPAMGDEELEPEEFEPMYDALEPLIKDKKVALFGSYSWNDGAWMDYWKERAEGAGLTIQNTVIAFEAPDDDAAAALKELGAALAG